MKENKRFWHFLCFPCGWKGIRYANQNSCPNCGRLKILTRLRVATKEDRDADLEEKLQKWREVPG